MKWMVYPGGMLPMIMVSVPDQCVAGLTLSEAEALAIRLADVIAEVKARQARGGWGYLGGWDGEQGEPAPAPNAPT